MANTKECCLAESCGAISAAHIVRAVTGALARHALVRLIPIPLEDAPSSSGACAPTGIRSMERVCPKLFLRFGGPLILAFNPVRVPLRLPRLPADMPTSEPESNNEKLPEPVP